MTETAHPLSHDPDTGVRTTGVLPYQALAASIRAREIMAEVPIASEQLQPASIDLRLGAVAYRVQASFLPGPGRTVQERIDAVCLHRVEPRTVRCWSGAASMSCRCSRASRCPPRSPALPTPSSTGRLDVFTRLITDYAPDFDVVARGYQGPLYAEIFPRTFSVIARTGSRLNQLRLTRGSPEVRESELKRLLDSHSVLDRSLTERELGTLFRGVPLSVDLSGIDGSALVGYRAKLHAPLIDLDRVRHYDPTAYWEAIPRTRGQSVILNPEDFYILASRESVSVPLDLAAEMVPYDAFTGEFRAHYAGFFDPGFGHADIGGAGTRAVLEVRSHGVPFMIEDGQLVGRLKYEHLMDVPDQLYGVESGSSYQRQGLALSKHFRDWPAGPL